MSPPERPGQGDRRLMLYGVGMGKSGTHSVADMFAPHYRAAHEAETPELMNLLFERWERTGDPDIEGYLRGRRRRLGLEVDASLVLGEVVDELCRVDPEAQFLLTIRDPWSWLDSMLNHSLAHATPEHWVRWRDHRYRSGLVSHHASEAVLADRGLYPLAGYLGAWQQHNQTILDTVPESRLLVVRTDALTDSIGCIADFVGVDAETIAAERSHAFPAAGHFDVLDELDEVHVDETVRHHAAGLLERFFPERV